MVDWDHAPEPREQRNGFVFEHSNQEGLASAMSRDRVLVQQPGRVSASHPQRDGHGSILGAGPGQHYLNIYDYIRHR